MGIYIGGSMPVFSLTVQHSQNQAKYATPYYVSSTGSDNNDGLTPWTPVSSITKVNTLNLVAGDAVLFKCGESFKGQITLKSGSVAGNVTYSSYGRGAKPLIHGATILNSQTDWVETATPNVWTIKDTTPTGSELVPNGTSATNFSGIARLFSAPAVGTSSVATDQYYTSPSALKYTTTTNGTDVTHIRATSNTFSVTAGKLYAYSFWVKATANMNINTYFTDNSWGSIAAKTNVTDAVTTTWKKITRYWLCTRSVSNAVIRVMFGNTLTVGNSIWFDDFTCAEQSGTWFTDEVGNIVFNDATAGHQRYSEGTLTAQGDYYFNFDTTVLKIYSVGNPAAVYSDVKCLSQRLLFDITGKSYISFKNLQLKYTSYTACDGTGSSHLSFYDCDVSWHGGVQWNTTTHVRMGNGLSFYDSCSYIWIEGCTVTDCFDAGLTHQSPTNVSTQEYITMRNNTIRNCEYSYEFFNSNASSITRNIEFSNNKCYNAGGGWGHSQRPDPTGRHITIWSLDGTVTNFKLENNVFDTAAQVYCFVRNLNGKPASTLVINNNTVKQSALFGTINFVDYATWDSYKAISGWDSNSVLL